jgi:SAM-dependent methyltransferase
MTDQSNMPALPTTVADLIAEYDMKTAGIENSIARFEAAFVDLERSATVAGTYAEPVASKPGLHAETLRKNLLKSGWKAIYGRLQIDRIASAKDKQLFERTIADPPPLTFDNAKATFGDYFERPRFHILRGLAEVFAALDPAYKSHSKVRIGVKGLPKRVILNGWGDFSCGYARDRFRDIINALAAYQGKVPFAYVEVRAIEAAHKLGEDAVLDGRTYTVPPRHQGDRAEAFTTIDRGMTVRKFANGNAHLFFDKWTLLDINKALAEFYGDVLPDAEDDGAELRHGTAVAKDLQFYWSPPAVVDAALDFAGIGGSECYSFGREMPEYRVLEPSCGDGRIMDELVARNCSVLGFEVDAGRADAARAKGHAVVTGNFLEQEPVPEFDKVVMNPPFYGRHYVKHVRHALRFLKPGGTLVSILPATAHYDHGVLDGEWRDLPVASFAEAGTNVPTTMLRVRVPT